LRAIQGGENGYTITATPFVEISWRAKCRHSFKSEVVYDIHFTDRWQYPGRRKGFMTRQDSGRRLVF
jgi:hypothetical protein